jgi:hypothetical protein
MIHLHLERILRKAYSTDPWERVAGLIKIRSRWTRHGANACDSSDGRLQ